jgi:hypothetical protein
MQKLFDDKGTTFLPKGPINVCMVTNLGEYGMHNDSNHQKTIFGLQGIIDACE